MWRNKRAVDLLLETLSQQSLDITTKQDLSKAISLEAFPSQHEAVQESWFALLRSGSAVPGIDCEDRWRFCTELETELRFSYMEDFSLSLLPSVHQCPNTAVLHQRGCMPGYWGQDILAQLTGSTTWCSWNLVVTLMLPRCCGCLRISQQFFLLFIEASSNRVPLGATRGLLLPSSSGAKMMDCLLGSSLFYWLVSSMSEESYFHLPIPWWGLMENWSFCVAAISCYPLACLVSGSTIFICYMLRGSLGLIFLTKTFRFASFGRKWIYTSVFQPPKSLLISWGFSGFGWQLTTGYCQESQEGQFQPVAPVYLADW